MADLLVITGSMGAGKTTVLYEASDLLTAREIPHAAIDLDALGAAHLPSSVRASTIQASTVRAPGVGASDVQDEHLMYRNLRSVWENYAGAGLHRLLLARALETRAELEFCREAVSAATVAVCRLTASVETMQARVQRRELGKLQNTFVARVPELEAILDDAHLEDFSVVNENRAVGEVAQEMLARAGWL
jgi:hypothetical protein